MTGMNLLSNILQPRITTPRGAESMKGFLSKSQKMFLELGILRTSQTGTNFLLPIGMRALTKLKNLVLKEMRTVSAQEVSLPILTPASLLQKTGRLDSPELFKLADRHNKAFVLSPTHEEAITSLLAGESQLSSKQFPLRLFQITNKFRDEMKPRFGLIRSREFIMKDLYCFDTSVESSLESYKAVQTCYDSFFKKLAVPFACVEGSTGDIGGSISHEYHFLSGVGEDKLVFCKDCKHHENINLNSELETCRKCKSKNILLQNGIEVGHTFLLGTKYTEPLQCNFNDNTNTSLPLQMSCFGLGLSRIIAASVEVLSTQNDIRWPFLIAPYLICIIPPKKGSKEEGRAHFTSLFYEEFNKEFEDEVVVDDRNDITIGRRLIEAKKFGFPFIVVIGKLAALEEPQIEVHNVTAGSIDLVFPKDICLFIKESISRKLVCAESEKESVSI